MTPDAAGTATERGATDPRTGHPATPSGRAWEVVLHHVENDLLEGRLRPGERLPGERELATRLGVGRSSVREAFRALEVLGLIRTSSGSGPSSGAIIIATPTGGMTSLLRLQVAAQGFPLADVVRTRLLLEEAVVGALASQEAADIDAARSALRAMDSDDLSPDEFLALDAQFHLALAEASGNIVVAAVMAGLRGAIETYVRAGAAALPDWPATVARLRAEHARIIDAVVAGDGERAQEVVRAHIAGYYAEAGLERP